MNTRKILILTLLPLCLASCKRQPTPGWLLEDNVNVAIDETFRPIMEEQLQQFGLMHPEATMNALYCSEDSALNLFLDDSIHSIVITRKLTDKEKDFIRQRKLTPREALIATDAFALILSKANTDTLISLDEVKRIVSGEITRWEQLENSHRTGELKLLFDHQGSSTVRFMRDSLCGGGELKGNVYAQGSNQAVIDFVKDDPSVIGVVGVDWLRAGSSQTLTSFRNLDVNVMLVRRDAESYHRRPYQVYIATGEYPLRRSVYAITCDPRPRSQEKFLWHWLKEQKGQLIFCDHSQLLPSMPVQLKAVHVK
ncbi:MAG: substrate-binding domain-containing protein [Alloprevotella sp.]|nr:substrate-binding domain-containing protein [Alloprevotella sp.]MBR1652874.1 substrate-binding domain-containing protein [Alloprevotella sp.]